jgi:hypothetical protein
MSPVESQHSLVRQAHQSLRIGRVERDHACQVGWRRDDDERGKITRKGWGRQCRVLGREVEASGIGKGASRRIGMGHGSGDIEKNGAG